MSLIKHVRQCLWILFGTTLFVTAREANAVAPSEAEVVKPPQPSQLSGLASHFTENLGQSPEPVRFTLRGERSTLYVLADSLLWHFVEGIDTDMSGEDPVRTARGRSVSLSFEGAKQDVRPRGVDQLPGRSHFFRGGEESRWRTNIRMFAGVETSNLYDSVSLHTYLAKDNSLKYDLLLEPFADPTAILGRFDGVDGIRLESDGSISLDIGDVEFRHLAPVAYQLDNEGNRRSVACRYVVHDDARFSFSLGEYDLAQPLVIDPPVSVFYFNYLGGIGNDHGVDVELLDGKAYVVGSTTSPDFPTTPGVWDSTTFGVWNEMFVAKFGSNGGLIYSTFIGSTNYDDIAHDIDVDRLGNAYIAATVGSHYPVTPGALQTIYGGNKDGAVTKLDPNGANLLYSTYVGTPGVDYVFGVTVNAAGEAHIVGSTTSFSGPNAFPTLPTNVVEPTSNIPFSASVSFVSKVNTAGSAFVWSTYICSQFIPPLPPFPAGAANKIELDDQGRPTVVGQTNFRFSVPSGVNTYSQFFGGGTLDGMVAQLTPDGTGYTYLTHLGGTNEDQGLALDISSTNEIVITGRSESSNFPLVNAFDSTVAGHDAFVGTLNPTQTGPASLVFSSFLGGAADDVGTGITVDTSGRIYVCGYTASPSEPLFQVNPILPFSGALDAFVTKIRAQNITFSTYLGGSLGDLANSIRVDSGGMYLVGDTQSTDFYQRLDDRDPTLPLVSNDPSFNGGNTQTTSGWTYASGFPLNDHYMLVTDAFVTKLDLP